MRALAAGGRIVTCGATTGPKGAINLVHLFARQLQALGSYMGTKGELLQAVRFLISGQLTALVDAVLPLNDAAEAHRRLERGDVAGKLVLVPE